MLDFIWAFNNSIFVFFTLFYAYQIIYMIIAVVKRPKAAPAPLKLLRYAVMIAARNEGAVIGELLKSIKRQTYPGELVDVYVIADNCTDDTVMVAQREGARVIERTNTELVGKGYALDYAFSVMKREEIRKKYDGFFVLDADNLLDEKFIAEMNKTFNLGYKSVTGYRNSKNFGDNWITSGYSVWFLREAAYLNRPRMILGTCCAVSGTGFLVHSDIIEREDGWKYYLLTEDIEFNANRILNNEMVAYCESAVFYDEQPQQFGQSWRQRLRWIKGTYQVLSRYGGKLFVNMFKKKPLAKFDILMSMAPALIVTFASALVNFLCLCLAFFKIFIDIGIIAVTLQSLVAAVTSFYLAFFCIAALTVTTEWKRINASVVQKILAVFTFPFFIFTYIPISVTALFKKVHWTPIDHVVVKSAAEFQCRE